VDAPSSLAGLVVADFSRVLAGPLATMFLADLGATVIKVEHPEGGDDTRAWGPPFAGDVATYYLSVNRNKYSVALDLGTSEGQRAARALAGRADVLVENFRVGALAKFGLDYEALAADNPRLVYCSISGYGSGAGASLPGYDFIAQAGGGLMSMTGPVDGPPSKVGVALVDVITGLHATIGVLAALEARSRTGRGQHVEVNLLSSTLSALVNQASGYLNTGSVPVAHGNAHPSIAPYETLPSADGELAVAAGNDRQFHALCGVLDLPGLADDPRFSSNASRVHNRPALAALLGERLRTRSAAAWTTELNAAGVPASPVNDLAGAFAQASSLGLNPVVRLDGTASVANPITLGKTPARYCRPAPDLGADTEAVLAWLDGSGELPQ
jgi:crotonobetainyl-CoA:carnitine CoA-transferase CaiB-like acyl-CoA transferase